MEYKDIKIGDVFRYHDDKETVVSKKDKYRIITTIDSDLITYEGRHQENPLTSVVG